MSVPPIGPATVVPSAAHEGNVQHPTVIARTSRSALTAYIMRSLTPAHRHSIKRPSPVQHLLGTPIHADFAAMTATKACRPKPTTHGVLRSHEAAYGPMRTSPADVGNGLNALRI